MTWQVWAIIISWLVLGAIGRVITRRSDRLILSFEVYFSDDPEWQRRIDEITEDIAGIILGLLYLILAIIIPRTR